MCHVFNVWLLAGHCEAGDAAERSQRPPDTRLVLCCIQAKLFQAAKSCERLQALSQLLRAIMPERQRFRWLFELQTREVAAAAGHLLNSAGMSAHLTL